MVKAKTLNIIPYVYLFLKIVFTPMFLYFLGLALFYESSKPFVCMFTQSMKERFLKGVCRVSTSDLENNCSPNNHTLSFWECPRWWIETTSVYVAFSCDAGICLFFGVIDTPKQNTKKHFVTLWFKRVSFELLNQISLKAENARVSKERASAQVLTWLCSSFIVTIYACLPAFIAVRVSSLDLKKLA